MRLEMRSEATRKQRRMTRQTLRQMMHLASYQRQMFAKLDAGHRGGNRQEFAADFQRSRRLHIPQILVRRSAFKKKHDA